MISQTFGQSIIYLLIYLLTYLLAPWTRVLEKLKRLPVPALSNINSVHAPPPPHPTSRRCAKSHIYLLLLRSYHKISLGLRHMCPFRSKASFQGEELLVLPPNPKLEDHPLSAVRDYLLNIFVATPLIGGLSSI